MTKFGQDFILALILIVGMGSCVFAIASPNVPHLVKILAGIAIFDILVVAFMLAKNW